MSLYDDSLSKIKRRLVGTDHLFSVVPVSGDGRYTTLVESFVLSHHYLRMEYIDTVEYKRKVKLEIMLRTNNIILVECSFQYSGDRDRRVINAQNEVDYVQSWYTSTMTIRTQEDYDYFMDLLFECEEFLGEPIYDGFYEQADKDLAEALAYAKKISQKAKPWGLDIVI